MIKLLETEKPFLSSEISLVQLANLLDIKPHILSYTINEGFNENFNQFINRYRIEEAKNLLINPKKNHLSISGIGYEVGFNSKSTFNATFKKLTNQTPIQFKNERLSEKTGTKL